MRKLTIKRHKSFVGCTATLKAYILDRDEGDLVICEDNCSLLGEIKNGEESTFEITNEETKVYVIADKASRDFCNDCYEISEGDEDITLTGKCKFNPAAANAFRFDGNDGVEASEKRKRSILKGTLILIGAVIIGMLVGYFGMRLALGGFSTKAKTFSVGDMSITLTEGFEQEGMLGYDAVFSSRDVLLFVNKDEVGKSDAILSLFSSEEYAKYVMQYSGINSQVKCEDGLVEFEFSGKSSEGEDYRYYAYVYKHENAHWMLQFAVKEGKASKYSETIRGFAKSVKFN